MINHTYIVDPIQVSLVFWCVLFSSSPLYTVHHCIRTTMQARSYASVYSVAGKRELERRRDEADKKKMRGALESTAKATSVSESSGFQRMAMCRKALEALDRRGWDRSYHQRYFHDHFIRACARVFWKVEPEGSFARDHQRILELNGWDTLDQEVLISTPRRFGKTISVSMFAAAMIFSVPNLECSIYSTCKRISQKLLRNIEKFLHLIYAELGIPKFRVIRCNMEEIVLKGPYSSTDVRVVNSYPSKVHFSQPNLPSMQGVGYSLHPPTSSPLPPFPFTT